MAISDQALFSGANFAINILLARWLAPAEYGAFSLAYSVFLLFAVVHTALLIEPLLVFGSGKYQRMFPSYVRVLLQGHVALMGPGTVLLFLTALVLGRVYSATAGRGFLGLAISGAAILLFWLVRRVFYVLLQPGWGVLGCAWALQASGQLSTTTAFLAMGAASLFASLILVARFGAAVLTRRIAQLEPRIRFVQNLRDLGHSGGLNRGLALCRGTWIARMDADDIALPDRLERQLAFAAANPDVKTTCRLAHYIDAHGKRVGKTVHDLTTRAAFARYRSQHLPIGLLHPGALIESATLHAIGGYRPELGAANDIDLWCRVSDRGLIFVQPEYLMEYRIHGESLSAQSFELARLKHLWARDCMIARRAGRPEPVWECFLAGRNDAAWFTRLNRWRKMHAKRLYRQAAQHRVASRSTRGLIEMGAAALLQPGYTIPRLRGQLSR